MPRLASSRVFLSQAFSSPIFKFVLQSNWKKWKQWHLRNRRGHRQHRRGENLSVPWLVIRLDAPDDSMTPATLNSRLMQWGTVLSWDVSNRNQKEDNIKLVVRLMITPVHCRMLLPRHAWNMAATAKPCFLASSRAFWNIKKTRNSVTVTSTLQIKKQIGTPNVITTRNQTLMDVELRGKCMTRAIFQMLDTETTNLICTSKVRMPRKRLATSTCKHRANHTLHPGRFSAGQRLCKRFWMRNCKPRNSHSRRNSLTCERSPVQVIFDADHRITPFSLAILLSVTKPSTQLRHKKRAAKRVCAVGAMRYSHMAAEPAIPVLTIKA